MWRHNISRHEHISVLLTTEGTYPFYGGGVGTWCHQLTHGLTAIDFRVLAVVTNPYSHLQYDLASNVREVIKVPQWGLVQPAEYSHHQPASVVLRNVWNTTPGTIAIRFRPIFERCIHGLFSSNCNKPQLGKLLLDLHRYFQHYDYEKTMNSQDAWEVIRRVLGRTWECDRPLSKPPTLAEMKQVYRLLYHLLIVLHFPIPDADVSHSSAASFCGLPCILAKLAKGTPYLLTEHGVYLREQYLNLRREVRSTFVRWCFYRLVENVVGLNYYFADQVSPVCAYNSRWERRMGVRPERIQVIFNGVNPLKFRPQEQAPRQRPQVSSVGAIYALKGQIYLVDAAAMIRAEFENLRVCCYGKANDQRYFESCTHKVSSLQLTDCVEFMGPTAKPWTAYNDADVVVFPSVSEGFPYAIVEAMACGAAVVATDVGGVAEALGDCGLLVPARNPRALADAVCSLLRNETERQRLGKMARARVLRHFTQQQCLDSYERSYRLLSDVPQRALAATPL